MLTPNSMALYVYGKDYLNMANRILQGFYSMPEMADNSESNKIAYFGELAPLTRTFTKDEKNFAFEANPGVELVTFQTLDDMKVSVTPGTAFQRVVVSLGFWILTQYKGNKIPNNSRLQEFINAISVEFPSLQDIKIGSISANETGTRNCIDWISFTQADGNFKWNCKIWCSNRHMFSEYEAGELHVIPPLEPVDGLQNSHPTLVNLLARVRPAQIIEKMDSIQGKHRATSTRTVQLTWHDPNDSTVTEVTNWYVVVYGNLINDLDLIKNAIRDYLSQNSGYQNWDKVYPELYSSNEFVYIPMYDDVAFPDSAIEDGALSSNVRTGNLSTIAQARIPNGYSQTANINTFMSEHLSLMSHTYRTAMILTLSNPANRNSIFKLKQLYPDYRALPTTDVDFDRMSVQTKEWTVELAKALELAWRFRENDVAPDGYYKIKRGLRTYLGFMIHGYVHLVLIRENY